jgi:outer membrane immunogenic protein
VKLIIAAAAVAAVSAVSAPAFAQINAANFAPVTYEGSIGYTGIQVNGADLGAIDLRARANFGQYVGIEGEGAFGVNDQDGNVGSVATKLHLNSEYAGYAVVRWPVIANGNLFARVGYGHSDIKATATALNGQSASASAGSDSVNYGVGGEYFFDGKNGLRVDYTRFDFQNNNTKDADTWSVGYVRKF